MRYLIYLFPVAINMLLGGMFFITAYRFSLAQFSGIVVGATMAAWAGLYSIVSLLIGRKLNSGNADKILNFGCAMLAAGSLGFLVFDALKLQFVWILVCGLGSASYCAPFQVLMKDFEPEQNGGGCARAAGMYTASWSIGMATGALIFGCLSHRAGFAVNTVTSFLLWGAACFLSRTARRKKHLPSGTADNGTELLPEESPQSLAKWGWLLGGIGIFTISIIRVMWPLRGTELHISKNDIGSSLALVSYVQALCGLIFAYIHNWMRKPLPALIFGFLGTLGLVLYAFAPGEALYFYLAAFCFGIYSGSFYFLFVYFSLEDTANAPRNVGINEFIVGVTGVAGPLFGGFLATLGKTSQSFYPEIALTFFVTLIMAEVLRRQARLKTETGAVISR